ncbi:MAG: efflux RND transporter permease subunit, partial [Myxococcota bacterium]
VLVVATLLFAVGFSLRWILTREFAPQEDRGAFFVRAVAPEGIGLDYMTGQMELMEGDLLTLIESGEATRVLVRVPASFGSTAVVNSAFGIVLLRHWDERDRSTKSVMAEMREKLMQHPGFRTFTFVRQGLSRRFGRPVSFVIGGPTYEELARWRDIMAEKVADYPGLVGVDFDYKETKPQLLMRIDIDRAADLGVSYAEAARTLETLFASRRVTTFENDGEEYDVILESIPSGKDSPMDLTNVYVRTGNGKDLVPLAAMASTQEYAAASELQRFNRQRAITLEANVADGTSLGTALEFLEKTAAEHLPSYATIDYKGQSLEYKESSGSLLFVLLVALAIVFLVLAAQFESWVQPAVIMLTVPLAVVGALAGLWMFGNTLNIYSQVGIVMLIGLAAKNGILVVEFANQLRDRGLPFMDALKRASLTRMRPILMTGVSTSLGALPLVLTSGAGAETRLTIGLVILFGTSTATLAALLVVPAAYCLLARNSRSPGWVASRLAEMEKAVRPLRPAEKGDPDDDQIERLG